MKGIDCLLGLREMNPDLVSYPNANSTMRVTYGNVGDYSPGDGAHYDYFTTIDGIMEKKIHLMKSLLFLKNSKSCMN